MSHVDDGTLHAYLDGDLAPAEAQGVAAHVAQCPTCRNRLDEERALIARAEELLGLAAPPDREIPPFRPGDVKPPVRLWWQVRLPLAWAATVVLALGVGTYLGSASARLAAPPADSSGDAKDSPPSSFPTPAPREPVAAKRSEPRPARLAREAPHRPAPAATAERKLAAGEEATTHDEPAAHALEQDRVAPAAAPPVANVVTRGDYELSGPPLTLDSARALLGTDPHAVPGLPVRGIYQARRIGYSAVVVVEQGLDSSTAIEVISGRPSSLRLEAVVVSDAAQADTPSPAERAIAGRAVAGARADSLAVAARKAVAPRAQYGAVADRATADLVLEVWGSLPADSLKKLVKLLKPLKP